MSAISLNGSTPTEITITTVPGLRYPVPKGVVVGTVSFDRTDIARGIALEGADARLFGVSGKFPDYKIVAAEVLSNASYKVAVAPALTGLALALDFAPPVVIPPVDPPVDPPPVSGWPSAKTAGVPAGTALVLVSPGKPLPSGTPSGISFNGSGTLVIGQQGATVSGWDIRAPAYITGKNVTLENCKVTAANFFVVETVASGTVVQNCTISGTGANNDGSNGIWGAGRFIANDVSNVENGISLFSGDHSGTVIQDNYIHDLKASGSAHYDGVQIDGGISNVTIRHNTIINPQTQTSAVMIDNGDGPISNITVDGNVLVGGGFTIYVDGQFKGGPISGVSITNNHMGSGYYGITNFNKTAPVYTGNVNDGASIAASL